MDERIVYLLCHRPNKGIQLAMDVYGNLCYSLIYGRLVSCASKEDIEECVSDVFTTLYRNRNQIDLTKGTLKAYLAKITLNKASDYYKRIMKQQVYELELDQKKVNSIADISNRTVDKKVLIDALKTLGEPDYTIFIWKYFFGYTSKEIGTKLEMKQNTVDKKISRGLKKLRLILEGGKSND